MTILCFSPNILPYPFVNVTEVLPQEATDAFAKLAGKVGLLRGYFSFHKNKIPLPVDPKKISTCKFPTYSSNMTWSHTKDVLIFRRLKGFLKKPLGVPLSPLKTPPHHSRSWHTV